MNSHTPTPDSLGARLGMPPSYGETVSEVLETCALIAAAAEHWDGTAVEQFLDQTGIHEKVWGRLIAIHRCDRWQQVDLEDLPGNYTALYALSTLGEEEWQELRQSEGLKRSLSSRQIHAWKDRKNLRRKGYERQMPLILAARSEMSKEALKEVLEGMKAIAEAKGMLLVLPTPQISDLVDRQTPEQVMKGIGKILIPKLTLILEDAGKVLKDDLSIYTEEDLLSATIRDFLKFINRTAGSAAAALEAYGAAYCLKLALEYHRPTNSRANRSNYKMKLIDLKDNSDLALIKEFAAKVLRDFVL